MDACASADAALQSAEVRKAWHRRAVKKCLSCSEAQAATAQHEFDQVGWGLRNAPPMPQRLSSFA